VGRPAAVDVCQSERKKANSGPMRAIDAGHDCDACASSTAQALCFLVEITEIWFSKDQQLN
jgi:hypothetical protein